VRALLSRSITAIHDDKRRPFGVTLYRSIAFLLFLLVLNAVEEIVVGAMHGRRVADSLINLARLSGPCLDRRGTRSDSNASRTRRPAFWLLDFSISSSAQVKYCTAAQAPKEAMG
jgi:hypothetical protein